MEINQVVISKKSTIDIREYTGVNFGGLIQVEFKNSKYYFKVTKIVAYKGTKLLFITAEQTGSSYNKLSDKIKGEDIANFCNSDFTEVTVVTDQSVIDSVNKSACYC